MTTWWPSRVVDGQDGGGRGEGTDMVSLRLERPRMAMSLSWGKAAGAAVACHLARAGVDVILMDRQRFPRDKVCGDFIGPAAVKEAEDLGLGAVPGYAGTNRIRRASVFLDGEHLITAPMPEPGGLATEGRVIRVWTSTRGWWTRSRRGCRLLPGVRVLDHEVRPDGVVVQATASGHIRSVRARLLVGADGSTSRVARRVKGRETTSAIGGSSRSGPHSQAPSTARMIGRTCSSADPPFPATAGSSPVAQARRTLEWAWPSRRYRAARTGCRSCSAARRRLPGPAGSAARRSARGPRRGLAANHVPSERACGRGPGSC